VLLDAEFLRPVVETKPGDTQKLSGYKKRWEAMERGFHGYIIWLVVSTPLKNISQLGLLFPIYGKIKVMFQTTNQIFFSNQI